MATAGTPGAFRFARFHDAVVLVHDGTRSFVVHPAGCPQECGIVLFTSFWRLGYEQRAKVARWAVNSSIGYSLFKLPSLILVDYSPREKMYGGFAPRYRKDIFPKYFRGNEVKVMTQI